MVNDSRVGRAGLSKALPNNNKRSLHSRNPFESPNLSTSSLNETDDGSTSGQDEFDLERYSENSRYQHLRQVSRSTNGEHKDAKPDLNIITSFTTPKMPMKSQAVLVSEVPAKRVSLDRRDKALSVASHKAVRAMATPVETSSGGSEAASGLRKLRLPSRVSKKGDSLRRLHNAAKQKQVSPLTQRIPIGITIPKEDAARVNETVTDSALPAVTPMTPAIVVTPAGNQQSWMLQEHSMHDLRRPASSIYSAYPFEKPAFASHKAPPLPTTNTISQSRGVEQPTASITQQEAPTTLPNSAEEDRPKSQGWWNLMLSPLLRNGSLASRKGRPAADTPPVPPLPFANEKYDSPAVSARSDPSLLVSPDDTSPDTPRRQGLASIRASTWSRWTEWEQEREKNALNVSETEQSLAREVPDLTSVSASMKSGPGLAADYFHACAVEQVTGQPYFECENHSCAEQLPKLHSVYDKGQGVPLLASPFQSPLGLTQGLGPAGQDFQEQARAANQNAGSLPDEVSPHVRQARTATVVKARHVDEVTNKEMGLVSKDNDKQEATNPMTQISSPPASPRQNEGSRNVVALSHHPRLVEVNVNHHIESPPRTARPVLEETVDPIKEPVSSPVPMSPHGEKVLAPKGAVPLSDVDYRPTNHPTPVVFSNNPYAQRLPPRPAFVSADTEYPALHERTPIAPVTAADLRNTSRRLSIEERRCMNEKEDATASKVGRLWRGRACFPKNGCMGRAGPESRTRRRWIIGISLLLLAIIITCIVLAVTLTRHGDGTPIDSQWLNLTGYPPMPIGILTIAAPNLVASQKQCVDPSSMWSCSVPKDIRNEIGPNGSDQPNVRFEIKFRNGTVPANMTIPLDGKRRDKTSKDPFTNDLFVANPTPPNQPDQIFLGQTSDNISAPFDGEQTPFYISFMSAFPVVPSSFNDTSAKLVRRAVNASINAIPAPALAADGSAAPATLLPTEPFPIAQPIRLYNRGLQDEHYGFYMYYDKSIYLSGVRISGNEPANNSLDIPEADQDGGCLKSEANSVCTFAQTRFLFKVFTNTAFGATLLQSTISGNLTNLDNAKKLNKTSSATNFERPGSFPYPTTIVVDRHGGDIDSKQIYCYGMDNGGVVQADKIPALEFRGVGGQPVNPAPNILGDDSNFNSTAGGVDGGTGGCFCNWQNWQ